MLIIFQHLKEQLSLWDLKSKEALFFILFLKLLKRNGGVHSGSDVIN